MSKSLIAIYKLPPLFDILKELENFIKFKIIKISKFNELQLLDRRYKNNYVVISNKIIENSKDLNLIVVKKWPLKLNKLIQDINIFILKNKFIEQSEIFINNYTLNVNTREFSCEETKLKLTQKEVEIILFLFNSKRSESIMSLKKKVWNYNSNLETHTVETHIYRLRKKIFNIFKDNNLIISSQNGYEIKK